MAEPTEGTLTAPRGPDPTSRINLGDTGVPPAPSYSLSESLKTDINKLVPGTKQTPPQTDPNAKFLAEGKAALESGENATEERMEVERQQALAQARKESEAADQYKKQGYQDFEDWQKGIQNPGPYIPTQETAGELAGIFSLMGLLGATLASGKGHESAMGAMASMTGMMDGWKQGRQDLYQKNKETYEKNVAEINRINELKFKKLGEAQKLAETDLTAGHAAAKLAFLEAGDTIGAKIAAEKHWDNVLQYIEYEQKIAQQQRDSDAKLKAAELRRGAGGGSQNDRFAYNVAEAFGQATQDLINVTKMPEDTVLGTFAGMTGKGGTGIIESLKNTFARKVTPEDQRQFQILISGFDQNMGRALGGGYANSGARYAVQAYQEQVAREGDSPAAKALFMARARQELNILGEFYAKRPGSAPYAETVEKYRSALEQVVPFTVSDVLAATPARKESNSKPTLDQFLEKARPLNPGVSDKALTAEWNKKYAD